MRTTGSLWNYQNLVSKLFVGPGIAQKPSYISTCKSHRLMLHAQLIAPSASGAFNFLPLGQRALDKLCAIVNTEMSNIGCKKVSMSCLSSASPWKTSKRWDSFGDELMKLKVSNTDHCLNPTHEEAITSMVASMGLVPLSNLPLKLYQISTKFRDEPRPKFGLLRCREFLMKDLYTFDKDTENAKSTYHEVCETYERIFARLNLNYIKAMSSCGKIGGERSNEYLVSAAIGEDKVYIGEEGTAWNAEYDGNDISSAGATVTNAIEIGHTFLLGQHYSKIFGAQYLQQDGTKAMLQMGCYGLGVTRILASCVEAFSNENEIRWPYSIAPFKVCIIPPKNGSKEQRHIGNIEQSLYSELNSIPSLVDEVIIDDRTDRTIGKRMHDAQLVGYPVICVIGKHIMGDDPKIEITFQNKGVVRLISVSDAVQAVSLEFR